MTDEFAATPQWGHHPDMDAQDALDRLNDPAGVNAAALDRGIRPS